jgi:predicted dienelactone hydrolase
MSGFILLAFAVHAQAQDLQRRYAAPGPWAVAVMPQAGCCDSKGKAFDIYAPKDIGRDRTRHPIVTWGNGTFASPDLYDYFLRHLASWGFVVVATRDRSTASGQTLLDAIAFLRKQEADPVSPFHGRLDFDKVAAVGHSQGAGGAMKALMAAHGAIRTAIAIELPSRKLCRGTDCADIPMKMPSASSVFFVSGSEDGISPSQSVQAYYGDVPQGRIKAMGIIEGTDHNDVQGKPRCRWLAIGCRKGVQPFLGYPLAWLMWQLQDDPNGLAIFRSGQGELFGSDSGWQQAASNVH